ncbi:SPATS2-like protein isoform X3 [Heterocephalus glaber]|uniref:SPATS2-like protein isoform X3 n=1 Tax=Heterocephalus glaber TaxID=10181 RepID=A0AAX6S600_HETGA|nr:SPATS2-like protein isoform X3 [Heterocephalus glaber]
MAELNTHVNVKEKIYAVRSVVPNKSNNEIVLVLQQFDFNVDKAVQAFVDGSAVQVLKEWNLTGKRKNNKRKRSKSKQHQGNKDAKDKAERPGAGPVQPQPLVQNGLVGSCEKDSSSTDSAGEKPALPSREKRISILEEPRQVPHGLAEGSKLLQQRLSLDGNPRPIHGAAERSDGPQWAAEQPWSPGKPKAKTSPVKPSAPAANPEIKPDELAKKRGPNIEKSVKDLQRCTVSLTRYRVMIKEEVDSSVKKIKAAFAELHNCIIDKEVSLMAEMDKVKEEAMEILTARQKKAEELKRLTDLASQMAELQLAELRAEIKNGPSSQRRRFNPQYHNNRLNGPTKSQGSGNEADPMAKGSTRHEHRRQPHNGFRPKNKGGTKNQDPPLGTKTPEALTHSEKLPRRRQHTVDSSEARPFRGNVGRVSQCNLCPTRIEVSPDATVLSVPAVTLVA